MSRLAIIGGITLATLSIAGSAAAQAVVVHAVVRSGRGEAAGLLVGDRLVSWRPLAVGIGVEALPPGGRLSTVTDAWFVEQEFGERISVEIQVERNGRSEGRVLESGPWGLDLRPDLSSDLVALWEPGYALAASGRIPEAVEAWQRLRTALVAKSDTPTLSWLMLRLGDAWVAGREPGRASAMYLEAARLAVAHGSTAGSAFALTRLATSTAATGDVAAAGVAFRGAVTAWREVVGRSVTLAQALHDLGELAVTLRDAPLAIESLSEALLIRMSLVPDSTPLARTRSVLGAAFLLAGRAEDADRVLHEALAFYDRTGASGSGDRMLIEALKVAKSAGQKRLALQCAAQVIDRLQRSPTPDGPLMAELHMMRAELEEDLGRPVAAAMSWDKAIGTLRTIGRPTHELAEALEASAALLQAKGDLSPARARLTEAATIRRTLDATMPTLSGTLMLLGNLEMQAGKPDDALPWFDEALAWARAHAPGTVQEALTLSRRATALLALGRTDEALQSVTASMALWERHAPVSTMSAADWEVIGLIDDTRGSVATAQRAFEKAEVILGQTGADPESRARVLERLIDVYQRRGLTTELGAARQRLAALNVKQ